MTRRLISLLAVALLVAACSELPSIPTNGYDPIDRSVDDGPQLPPQQQVAAWLEQAEDSDPPRRQRLKLLAAELLLTEQQTDLAEELLLDIDRNGLPYDLETQLSIARATVASRRGDYGEVLALLTDQQLQSRLSTMDFSLQMRASQLRAIAYSRTGEYIAAARERVYIHPMLDDDARTENNEAIWSSLTRLSVDELKQSQRSLPEQDFRGWLELATIALENTGNLEVQASQIDDWQRRWRNHPAANPLPAGLGDIRRLAEEAPQQVALLLPTTGKLSSYGKAIRDGFLAAWHQAQLRGAKVPLVRAYDSASGDITELYDRAVNDGAELVIGPLHKRKVVELARNRPAPEVPILALNRVTAALPVKMFQFGLAPEDEAEQVARIAWADGHSRALVLAPRGSWGENVAARFATNWRELGGSVVSQGLFSASRKDYSQVVSSSLNISASKQRAQSLRNLLGQRLQFEPYRRTDIDFIFLLARPHEARAIKPLLRFHYAGDLPVYATSQVYSASSRPDRDRDLDGLMFTEIPWLLGEDTPLREQISRHLPKSGSRQRFYAMGVDTYLLHPRLAQLQRFPHSQVFGNTGSLRMDAQRRITRELQLARIKNGKPRQIMTSDDTTLSLKQ